MPNNIPKEAQNSEESAQREEELSAYKIRAAAYKKIIERYADAINAGEQKTVPQLKELVRPENAAIQGVKNRLLEKISEEKHARAPPHLHEKSEHEYDYARDFAKASSLALEFVKTLLPVRADLPVSYWLSPQEVLELNAADPTDKAIFLCSLLQALECKSARVRMVELENGTTHPLALFEFEGKSVVVDASDANAKISGKENTTFESQLAAMKIAGQKIKRSLYEFNNEEYEEFE